LLSILINSENKEDDLSKLYDELRRLYMSRWRNGKTIQKRNRLFFSWY
jgi:hypothetical protein